MRNTAKLVQWSIVAAVFSYAFTLIISLGLAAILEPHRYGVYRSIVAVASFAAAVGSFGLRDTIRRFTVATKFDSERRKQEVVGGIVFTTALSSFLMVILLAFGPDPTHGLPSAKVFKLLTTTLAVLIFASSGMEALLQGLDQYRELAIARCISFFFGIAILSAVAFSADLVWVVAATAAYFAVSCACLGWFVGRERCQFVTLRTRYRFEVMREICIFSLGPFVAAMAIPFCLWWITFRLGRVSGFKEVGLFSVAFSLVTILGSAMAPINAPLLGVMTDAVAGREPGRLAEVVAQVSRLFAMAFVLVFCVVLFWGESAIALLFGENYRSSALLMKWLAGAMILRAVIDPIARRLIATGETRILVIGYGCWTLALVVSFEGLLRLSPLLAAGGAVLLANVFQLLFFVSSRRSLLPLKLRNVLVIIPAILGVFLWPNVVVSFLRLPLRFGSEMLVFILLIAYLWFSFLSGPDRDIILRGLRRRRI